MLLLVSTLVLAHMLVLGQTLTSPQRSWHHFVQ
jgi:hypothetical protein